MQLLQAIRGLGDRTPETARTSGSGKKPGRLDHRVGRRYSVKPTIQQVLQSLAILVLHWTQEDQGEVQGLGTHPTYCPFQSGRCQLFL